VGLPMIKNILLILFVGAGVFGYVWFKYKPQLTTQVVSEMENVYKGDYLGFRYPKKFKLEKVVTTDGRVLENWFLTESTASATTIAITLFASNKELGDFEPVAQRRADTTQFIEAVGRMRQQRGILFKTIDNKERTVFFTNKKRILMVDYIAKTTDPEKETEYQNFLEGINWE